MVGQRRNLLEYLKGKDIERYRALIEKLGLRKVKEPGGVSCPCFYISGMHGLHSSGSPERKHHGNRKNFGF